jgi:hypothetical protein
MRISGALAALAALVDVGVGQLAGVFEDRALRLGTRWARDWQQDVQFREGLNRLVAHRRRLN